MSQPSRPPSAPAPVELEPVTCWPLIIGAIGFVCLGLITVGGFAAWTALFPSPKAVAVAEEPRPTPAPTRAASVDLPPVAEAANENERQVKVRREVIENYRPMPPVKQVKVEQLSPPLPRGRLVTYKPPVEKVPTFPKPSNRSEEQLLKMLWQDSSEVGLQTEKDAGEKMFEASTKHMESRRAGVKSDPVPPLTSAIRALLESRYDLRGLPVQDEKACQSTKEAARILREVSLRVRRLEARGTPRGIVRGRSPAGSTYEDLPGRLDDDVLYLQQTAKAHRKNPLIVRPLEQMFQTERVEARMELISAIAGISGKEATQALARRAVFDLSPEVRAWAVKAIEKRSVDDARPLFLAALRHPWAPAADHAAHALADLNDQKAIESVTKMIDQADPRQPFMDGKKWYVNEMVRINHLHNCLLCHAVSLGKDESVTAPIPTPGRPLPAVYYERSPRGLHFVRADIVYFRQDFSTVHKVAKPNMWPAKQRFDYFVRKRELTAKEIEKLTSNASKHKTVTPKSYPQRDALLYTVYRLAFAKGKADRPSR
jgi:hypothetical protein